MYGYSSSKRFETLELQLEAVPVTSGSPTTGGFTGTIFSEGQRMRGVGAEPVDAVKTGFAGIVVGWSCGIASMLNASL